MRRGRRLTGGPTHGGTCELRREKGIPLTASTAQAGAISPSETRHGPGHGHGPGPGPILGPSFKTRAPVQPRGRKGKKAGARDGARGPDLTAASGGGEGPFELSAPLPVRTKADPAQPRRPLGLRGAAATGRSPAAGGRTRGGDDRATFGLAVGAVLVVLLPQQLGQDELVLLVQLLSLLPAGTRRHLGSGAESPGQLQRRRVRTGAGLGKRTWSRWDRGQTQPQEAAAAAAGTGGAAAEVVAAPTCPASSPGRPRTHREAGEKGERGKGRGRGFRVAPQEGTQTPGSLRMR